MLTKEKDNELENKPVDASEEQDDIVQEDDESAEEVYDDNDALNETIDDLQQEVESYKSEIEELKANIDAANSKIAFVAEKIGDIAKELGIVSASEPVKEDSSLRAELEALKSAVASLEAENQALMEQNAALKASAVRSLVDRIVSMKLELGDLTEDNREKETEKLLARTEESLLDTLEDLESRKREAAAPYFIEKVVNPGLADNSQPGITIEVDSVNTDSQEKESNLTPGEVFRNLFLGPKAKGGKR